MAGKAELVAMGEVPVATGKAMFIQMLAESVPSPDVRKAIVNTVKPLLEGQFRQAIKDLAGQAAQAAGWIHK